MVANSPNQWEGAMPEVPMCIHCEQPIDEQTEQYVVTNKSQEWKKENWHYAHVECQKQKAKK